MPGNVVRGTQKYAKNLYRCNGPWLTALGKENVQTSKCSYSRNILTRLQLDLAMWFSITFISASKNKWLEMEMQAVDFILNLIYPKQGVVW